MGSNQVSPLASTKVDQEDFYGEQVVVVVGTDIDSFQDYCRHPLSPSREMENTFILCFWTKLTHCRKRSGWAR